MAEYLAQQYIDDVMEGRIVTCKYVKQAVERHVRDLETGHERGLWFDEAAAKRRIDFYQFCRHSKGQFGGQIFKPEPWQQFIDWFVFGWKREDGTRRIRLSYVEVARKNGKSTKISTDGLYLLKFDGEAGAQVFNAATKREQALIVHSEAINMVRQSPALREYLDVTNSAIFDHERVCSFRPLGKDSNTEDGLNPNAAIIDEYHAHPDAGMYNVLRSAVGARTQPIIEIITTAGFDKDCPCYEEHERIINILEGKIEDDSTFGIIYTLDEGDDWQDEGVWIKSNPNLGISVDLEDMRDMKREAIQKPSQINNFLTKKLNIWTQAVSRWISDESWGLTGGAVNERELRGRKAFGAFDLSSTTDITAWALCFPPVNEFEKYRFLLRFFIPEDDILERERRDKVPYKHWIEQGWIIPTPGNAVDYNFIEQTIKNDVDQFNIQQIAYDPWNASHMVTNLTDEGYEMVKFSQAIGQMSPATKDFENKVLGGELAFGDNPVMNWMIGCTEVKHDINGNYKPIKPDKGRSGKRIDGVIAAIMALNITVRTTDGASVYDTRGILTI